MPPREAVYVGFGLSRTMQAMSRFGTEYHVGRSTGRCALSHRVLEPGTACIAALCERNDEGFERLDFAIEAWDAGPRPPRLFSFWKTVVPKSDTKPRLLLDDQVLLDLFERLAQDQRPQRISFRFVLGLILMRKKAMKFVGRTVEGDAERWLLQPRGGDPGAPPIELVNPKLSDDDVRNLIDHLSEILQSEL